MISCLSQKGGVGKTTIAINLAGCAAYDGKSALLLDLDPQQSAARWARLRHGDNPLILPAHAPNLAEMIDRARDGGVEMVIIDTAPKSESSSLAAAKLSDHVLIPCQPSSLDIDAIGDSVQIAKLAGVSASVVLTHVKARSTMPDFAADALVAYDVPLAPVRLGNRVAFTKSLAEGKGLIEYRPAGPSAAEIRHLYTFTCQQGDATT